MIYLSFLLNILLFFLIGFGPIVIWLFIKKKSARKRTYQNVEPLQENAIYYREIPFENLGDAFWLSYCGGLMENAEDIFYAFLLKWHLEGYIDVYMEHGVYYARVKKKILYTEELETKVFKHIFLWGAYKTPVKISNIRFTNNLTLEKSLRISYHNLKRQGFVLPNNIYAINSKGAFSVPDNLKPKLEALIGLKKFLEEFTLIHEKSVEAIHLYEMYLVYAELFGIADKVEEELNIYMTPELISFYIHHDGM